MSEKAIPFLEYGTNPAIDDLDIPEEVRQYLNNVERGMKAIFLLTYAVYWSHLETIKAIDGYLRYQAVFEGYKEGFQAAGGDPSTLTDPTPPEVGNTYRESVAMFKGAAEAVKMFSAALGIDVEILAMFNPTLKDCMASEYLEEKWPADNKLAEEILMYIFSICGKPQNMGGVH